MDKQQAIYLVYMADGETIAATSSARNAITVIQRHCGLGGLDTHSLAKQLRASGYVDVKHLHAKKLEMDHYQGQHIDA